MLGSWMPSCRNDLSILLVRTTGHFLFLSKTSHVTFCSAGPPKPFKDNNDSNDNNNNNNDNNNNNNNNNNHNNDNNDNDNDDNNNSDNNTTTTTNNNSNNNNYFLELMHQALSAPLCFLPFPVSLVYEVDRIPSYWVVHSGFS